MPPALVISTLAAVALKNSKKVTFVKKPLSKDDLNWENFLLNPENLFRQKGATEFWINCNKVFNNEVVKECTKNINNIVILDLQNIAENIKKDCEDNEIRTIEYDDFFNLGNYKNLWQENFNFVKILSLLFRKKYGEYSKLNSENIEKKEEYEKSFFIYKKILLQISRKKLFEEYPNEILEKDEAEKSLDFSKKNSFLYDKKNISESIDILMPKMEVLKNILDGKSSAEKIKEKFQPNLEDLLKMKKFILETLSNYEDLSFEPKEFQMPFLDIDFLKNQLKNFGPGHSKPYGTTMINELGMKKAYFCKKYKITEKEYDIRDAEDNVQVQKKIKEIENEDLYRRRKELIEYMLKIEKNEFLLNNQLKRFNGALEILKKKMILILML